MSVGWDHLAEWERRLLWDQTNAELAVLARRIEAVRDVLDHTGYHPIKDAISAALEVGEVGHAPTAANCVEGREAYIGSGFVCKVCPPLPDDDPRWLRRESRA